ncbi:helix-turn-helix domain-containing protein [Mangrovibacterium marinum]|uniref:TolB-like protein n=1 Tax=Mangrovibacterium marinum TaxID=1639118 RepID=A0A2T5C4X5_9BACT|nr:helix-turn-helix domain-containing protein [Mangrovibacterium marinum]PTN09897.1 TolB-like protein [Mangrovibacterium marinum]
MNNKHTSDLVFLQRLTETIEQNLKDEHFGVSKLAKQMGMSRSNLYLKINAITGKSVSCFIREVRLRKALQYLKEGELNVSETAYEVGFGSPTYFSKCFHDYFGFPPGEVGLQKEDQTAPPENTLGTGSCAAPVRRIRKRLFSGLGFILLVIAGIWILKPLLVQKQTIEKSIVVLPFIDDSPEAGHSYIVDGLMEEILNKLSLISDLRVVSRTSAEHYRNSTKSSREIGKEVKANYLLEGSAQTINNTIRIRLQLIETSTNKHLWSKPFEREVTMNNIFRLQSELALLIADELDAVITRDEKNRIRRIPTVNPTAYNLYLRGLDYKRLYELQPLRQSWQDRLKAKQLFQQAVQLDSTFADAWAQLGDFYIRNIAYWGNIYLKEQYLDSGLLMLNTALKYDRQNWKALALEGRYYLLKGMPERANALFQELPVNEKNLSEYYEFAFSHFLATGDNYNALKSFLAYNEVMHDKMAIHPGILVQVGWILTYEGYPEVAGNYAHQMLQLYNDSIKYFKAMNEIATMSGNFEAAMDYCQRIYEKDSTRTDNLYYMMINSVWLRDYPAAYKYLLKYGGKYINSESAMILPFVYEKNGLQKEAREGYQKALKICNDEIKLNNFFAQIYFSHAALACVYSALGDTEKSLEYLRQVRDHQKPCSRLFVVSMKHWPLLDNVRQQPEFDQILADMEASYKQEHQRAGSLLREKGIIQ